MGKSHGVSISLGGVSTGQVLELKPLQQTAGRLRHLRRSREQNAVFCSHVLSAVNRSISNFRMASRTIDLMTPALFDQRGYRKYLVARERLDFACAAAQEPAAV